MDDEQRKPKPKSSTDAFRLLMKKNRKDRVDSARTPEEKCNGPSPKKAKPSKGSMFVPCPVCEKHVFKENINAHLDTCVAVNDHGERKSSEEEVCDAPLSPSQEHTDAEKSSQEHTDTEKSDGVPSPLSPGFGRTNAFTHLMERSHRLAVHQIPIQQRFHLHDIHGNVSWRTEHKDSELGLVVLWSSTVMIKRSKGETHENERDLELIVSSSVPSSTVSTLNKLVRRPSRLSVPVLKSSLQKSVRRRRPLPSVKIAMELASKSLGDLLRRLPIISLEDSTLHPLFPFIVWLMVAYSKDFQPPMPLVFRVMQIVFEIAACSWRDTVEEKMMQETNTNSNDNICDLSLISIGYLDEECKHLPPICSLFLRTMLLRKQYGGMACDIKMLSQYVNQWLQRFKQGTVPDHICSKVIAIEEDEPTAVHLNWCDLPLFFHKDIKSEPCIKSLVDKGLEALSFRDIGIAGIDFHCSSVLEDVMKDPETYNSVKKLLKDIPDSPQLKHEYVLSVLKHCMWKFSAGVNHRGFF